MPMPEPTKDQTHQGNVSKTRSPARPARPHAVLRQSRPVLLLLAAVFACASSAFAADGTFDRTLKVNGPVVLGVDTDSGNIHVTAGAVSTVHIVGHLHSSKGWFGGDDATARLQQLVANPPINQAGNIISMGHNLHLNNISIDYEITAPRGTDVRANTGSGDIVVRETGAPAELRSGSGNVNASGLSGHVALETGSGDIDADMLSALDVKAQTGSGDITLKNVQSSLWAQTGSGTLHIAGKPLAAWKLQSGSGDVELQTAGTPLSLNATTGSGDIHVEGGTLKQTNGSMKDHLVGTVNGGGPEVRIVTGSGDIRIH